MYFEERKQENKTFERAKQKVQFKVPSENDDFSDLEGNLLTLETQFMKMQKEYINKIKQLKGILIQKNKKQTILTVQINSLRQNFRFHQDQIAKVTEQFTNQSKKQLDSSNPKRNGGSPGLVKKSLESYRKLNGNNSPSAAVKTKQTSGNLLAQNTNNLQNSNRASPQLKKGNLILLHSKKNSLYNVSFANSNDKLQKSNDLTIKVNQKPLIQDKSEKEIKRKSYSPKLDSELKNFLLQSMKTIQNQKVTMPKLKNGSPKRIIKNSPTRQAKLQKAASFKPLLEEEFECF